MRINRGSPQAEARLPSSEDWFSDTSRNLNFIILAPSFLSSILAKFFYLFYWPVTATHFAWRSIQLSLSMVSSGRNLQSLEDRTGSKSTRFSMLYPAVLGAGSAQPVRHYGIHCDRSGPLNQHSLMSSVRDDLKLFGRDGMQSNIRRRIKKFGASGGKLYRQMQFH